MYKQTPTATLVILAIVAVFSLPALGQAEQPPADPTPAFEVTPAPERENHEPPVRGLFGPGLEGSLQDSAPNEQKSPKAPDLADVDAAPECDVEKIKEHLNAKVFKMPKEEDFADPAKYCKLQGERRYFKDKLDARPISIGLTEERVKQATEVGAASALVDPYRSYSSLYFNCLPNCDNASTGLTEAMVTLSTVKPTINAGLSWNNYAYANRIHFGVSTYNSCSWPFDAPANLAVGLAYGSTLDGTVQDQNMRVFVENWFGPGNNCYQDIFFSIPWNPNNAMLTRIWTAYDGGTYAWVSAIWYGGGWFYVADIRGIPYARANSMDIGQEMIAYNGDKQNMHIPLNFAHKNRVVTAWPGTAEHTLSDHVLPSIYQNKTVYIIEQPLRGTDVVGGDFTSISSYKP